MDRCENLIDRLELSEMANAIPKYTGLEGYVVYFSTKYELTNKQSHSLGRVKIYKGSSNIGSISIQLKDTEFITIFGRGNFV